MLTAASIRLSDKRSVNHLNLVHAAALLLLAAVAPAWSQQDNAVLLIEQSPQQGGRLNLATGVHTFDEQETVILTASPNPGWQFVYWLGDVTDATSNTTMVYMNSPKIVVAVFEQTSYEWTAIEEKAQLSMGSPSMVPAGPDYARGGVSPTSGPPLRRFHWPDMPEINDDLPVPGDHGDPPVPEVPEPLSAVLLAFGALLLRRKDRIRRPGKTICNN